jgi:hypothetical protein
MNDALNLPRPACKEHIHLSKFPAIRWLDDDGCVRMGRLLSRPNVMAVGLAFDELTHQVYFVDTGEYEPNVQKDANGNPVT